MTLTFQPPAATWPTADSDGPPYQCRQCGGEIAAYEARDGRHVSAQLQAEYTLDAFGKPYCRDCRSHWGDRKRRRLFLMGCRV